MSSGEVKKVSRQDIQLVQNLIERCLQLYMNQKEVVRTLLDQAKIEPGFTELVWQKLEEENQEFFKAYHLRLIVKDQILRFNQLLERQVNLMDHLCATGVASVSLSNGSQIPPMHQNTASHAAENTGHILKSTNIGQPLSTRVPNAYINGASSPPCMQTGLDMPAHARRIDVSSNVLLAQNSNVRMIPGANGGVIKTEAGYTGNSSFMFGVEGNIMESRPAIADASVSPFSSVESNSQPLNAEILEADTSSFGFLGQIPRNFSLSDLTADFANSSDILESYARSPFLGTDTDNFLDPRGRAGH